MAEKVGASAKRCRQIHGGSLRISMLSEKLQVGLIQSDLVWENPEENRINFTNHITTIVEEIDLFILPEMFTTGFTMNAEHHFETMNGDTVTWMQTMASQKHAAICGSIIVKENETFFNRFLFVYPDGEIKHYDKRHTFTLAGEDRVYQKGNKREIIDYKGWTISPQVCYDLRFPVWARNTVDYDVLIYVANWPEIRVAAWDALLKARAIENLSYCIGVNRIGLDGNGHPYCGHSKTIDPMGNIVGELQENEQATIISTLSKEELTEIRQKLNFLEDRDSFVIN